jgi:hypothetical protein
MCIGPILWTYATAGAIPGAGTPQRVSGRTRCSPRRHRRDDDVLCCNMCPYFFPFLAFAFFWTPPRMMHLPKPSQVSSSISGGTLHFSLPL